MLLCVSCLPALQRVLVPALRHVYNVSRPLFISDDYLRQERMLEQRMANASSFADWRKAANELDRLQGEREGSGCTVACVCLWGGGCVAMSVGLTSLCM